MRGEFTRSLRQRWRRPWKRPCQLAREMSGAQVRDSDRPVSLAHLVGHLWLVVEYPGGGICGNTLPNAAISLRGRSFGKMKRSGTPPQSDVQRAAAAVQVRRMRNPVATTAAATRAAEVTAAAAEPMGAATAARQDSATQLRQE